jgi:hypothetical protein
VDDSKGWDTRHSIQRYIDSNKLIDLLLKEPIHLPMQVLLIGSALRGINSTSHNSSSNKPSNQPHDHDRGKNKYILTFHLLAVWQSKEDQVFRLFPCSSHGRNKSDLRNE